MHYVKTLKHNEKISEILIGLYDNNIARILFENDDIHEIIFNNYKTINLKVLANHIPIDATIKTIFDILSHDELVMHPRLNDNEMKLLSKYIFTYLPDAKINELVKRYDIAINNEHIDYYAHNEYWNIDMFGHLIKHGAKPNINTVLCACEKKFDNSCKDRWLLYLLRMTINENDHKDP